MTSTEILTQETRSKEAVSSLVEETDAANGFCSWFKERIVASSFAGTSEIPKTITSMPCGCTRNAENGTPWTIHSEPLEQAAHFRTSQVMVHSACGECIGEIPTPWMTL